MEDVVLSTKAHKSKEKRQSWCGGTFAISAQEPEAAACRLRPAWSLVTRP